MAPAALRRRGLRARAARRGALISREYTVGIATARILVDTPSSQVADVSPKGVGLVGTPSEPAGHRDGRRDDQVSYRPPRWGEARPARWRDDCSDRAVHRVVDLGTAPVSAPSGPNVYALTTEILTDNSGNNLPIIQLSAQAPTATSATRLADAATASVSDYVASKAAAERIPNSHRLQINALNASPAGTDVRGPSKIIGVVVVLVVIFLGCAAILGIQALVRGWRAASARERAGSVSPRSHSRDWEDERAPSLVTEEDSFRKALRAER